MFTAILKLHEISALGAIIEAVIGCLYQYASNKRKGDDKRHKTAKGTEKVHGYFMALLIPLCIWGFSFMYAEFDGLREVLDKIFN